MGEVLAPTRKDIAQELERGFAGMTEVPVALDDLLEARERIIVEMIDQMPRPHKEALLAFKAEVLTGHASASPMPQSYRPSAGAWKISPSSARIAAPACYKTSSGRWM